MHYYPYGCGRRGISKDFNPHLVTIDRRVHIVLVSAGVMQARAKVAKNRRSRGRPQKSNSDDPWAGGLSPSAKAFTMIPKLSPRSVQCRESINRSADKRINRKDDKTKAKQEDNGLDLEVKIVPKFPTDGVSPRTFRNQVDIESDDDTGSLNGKKRRGRPKKYLTVLSTNSDDRKLDGEVIISPKASSSKKVTIVTTSPVKLEVNDVSKGRRSVSGFSSKRDTLSKDSKGDSVNKMPKEDGSRPSRKLLKSKFFKEAPAYHSPLIKPIDPEYRAVTVQKVIPAHILNAASRTGFKLSNRNLKIKPSKVVLTKLEVSPEEALNRLFLIEALLKAQKGKRTAKAATLKAREKVKQEQVDKVRPFS